MKYFLMIYLLLLTAITLAAGCTLIMNNGTLSNDDRDQKKSGINLENEPDSDNRK